MIALGRRVMTLAVAGLCLLGLLGTVSVAAATTRARPVPAFSCGGFDHWISAPAGAHFSATTALGPTTATLEAYPLTGSESLDGVDIWIGNPGVDVEANPHGKGVIIVTGDDDDKYQFASFADSGMPLEVLTFRNGGFADTTRAYPDLVRNDAAQWWKSFSDDPGRGLGTLAAWAADQWLLGKGRSMWATIDRQLAEGRFGGHPGVGNPWPTGADYVGALHAFLPQRGYCQ